MRTLLSRLLPCSVLLGGALSVSCGPSLECGEGTAAVDGRCVPADPLQCGPGTVESDGVCVPQSTLECGPGTTLDGGQCVAQPALDCGTGTQQSGNECVPDGTVICGDGTTYDPGLGACVLDPASCGAGTVRVNGVCVTADAALVADLEELPESGGDLSGEIELPAEGSPGVVVHGCIVPRPPEGPAAESTADTDVWTIHTDAPTLLEITADGVGGLAAGFVVLRPLVPGQPDFHRFGINMTSDLSARQVFLPEAGDYQLLMGDSRAFSLGGAAGSPTACYFTTVRTLPLPAPVELSAGVPVSGTLGGEAHFFRLSGQPAAAVAFTEHSVTSSLASGAFVVLRNGQLESLAETDPGLGTVATAVNGGLSASDALLIVVDPVHNYALTPPAFQLVTGIQQSAPIAGAPITVESGPASSANPFSGLGLSHFEVTSSETVVELTVATTSGQFVLLDARGMAIESDLLVIGGRKLWGRFEPGLYYLGFNAQGTPGATYEFTASVSATLPTPITPGTPISSYPLTAGSPAWFSVNAPPSWMVTQLAASGVTGNFELEVHPDDVGRVLDDGHAQGGTRTLSAIEPGRWELGMVTEGLGPRLLLKLTPPNTANLLDSLEVNPLGRDLGTLEDRVPVVETLTLTGTAPSFVFVRAPVAASVTVTATPAAGPDIEVLSLDRFQSVVALANAGGVSAAETLPINVAASAPWVALAVRSLNTAEGDEAAVTLTFEALLPRPYAISSGARAFVDVCFEAEAQFLLTGEDEALSSPVTLPWAFPLYNGSSSTMRVSSNGFAALGGATSPAANNSSLPRTASPHGTIAPLWDDLAGVDVCTVTHAGDEEVIVQWTGGFYEGHRGTVEMQLVLHRSGTFSFLYGPNHQANTGSATVGVENLAGSYGQTLAFNNLPDATPAYSSKVFTPAP